MDEQRGHLDLREEEEGARTYTLSLKAAIVVALTLSLLGIAAAWVLPSLSEEEAKRATTDWDERLQLLSGITVKYLNVTNASYEDIPLDQACFIAFHYGDALAISSVRETIESNLPVLLEGASGGRITIVPGWSENDRITSETGDSSGEPTYFERTAEMKRPDGETDSIDIRLEIWEV